MASSAFGFSIAYQNPTGAPVRLVVGAPRADYVGKVYSCPLSDLSSINCSVIDMTSLQIEEKTAAARKLKNPDQNYYFGSSIAATSDYFFTCAPLLIKTIELYDEEIYDYIYVTETFGGCYVNSFTTAVEWTDSALRVEDIYQDKPKFSHNKISFWGEEYIKGGALGWNTLVDDSFLIVPKCGLMTDILYSNAGHLLDKDIPSKSLLDDANLSNEHFNDFYSFYNLGYGLAVGKFFDEKEKLYAVSLKKNDTNGTILFLERKQGVYLDFMEESDSNITTIETYALSSMFGYAMAAADLNRDGLSELLVGAPAQTEEGRRELGALHIFVGGDLLSRNDKKRMRTVLADKVNGRFGSAIATSDIDGDSLPEIFVSAPYEDSGVVYALSGYELRHVFFREDGFQQARLAELKQTQVLRGGGGFQLFGFSLQVVTDVDKNGCDELAIGSPDSSSVELVRCLPAVNTTLSLELLGDSIVAVDAKSFNIEVCLNITINEKCQSVAGNISVESFTTGHTTIAEPKFTRNIMTYKKLPHCEQIYVDLTKVTEQTDYTFTTKLSIVGDDTNSSVYKSLAVLSAYSETEKSITVRRYCTGAHCEPDLSYKMLWSGGDIIDFSKSEDLDEMLTFELKNANFDAHFVVLELLVEGALVRSRECALNKNIINVEHNVKAYTCTLVKMLKKDDSYNMKVSIYQPAPTNSLQLNISAKLYDAVFPNKTFEGPSLVKPYELGASVITVNGSNTYLNVTDKDLQDGIKLAEEQAFTISNNGPVTWYGIPAVLRIKNKYIQRVTVVTRSENEEWDQQNDPKDSSTIIFHSLMTIKPKSKKKIEVSMWFSMDKLESVIHKGDLSIISELALDLKPLPESREAKSSTQIIFSKILTVGNSKWLIILIVVILSVFLLLILMLVLYKHGFFKRAEKKKLGVLRESIRKRSVRLASEHSRGIRPSVADGDHCEIEVVDDCAFHEVDLPPTSASSDRSLVDTSSKELTS